MLNKSLVLLILFTVLVSGLIPYGFSCVDAVPIIQNHQQPTVSDPNLKVELVARGLKFPTSMAFLGPNDILVLEKNNGTVQRIVNGVMLPHPLLDVNVANEAERGMLGIAVAKQTHGSTYVFLYYTESSGGRDGDDVSKGKEPLGNMVYRYELVNNTLINSKRLLHLPATPGPEHNGGKMIIGTDNNVYLVIGDVLIKKSKTKNVLNALAPDGRGGILRITQDGKPVGNGILGNKYPLNLYYAYGIRNSFGIDFDPVTKKLWDTENGSHFGDEINLVEPGFNSGWNKVQGIWKVLTGANKGNITIHPSGLVDFKKEGKYSPPEFIWNRIAGPTAIKFLNSYKLGKEYQNDLFVADFHRGNIYHFDLNKKRTGLSLKGLLLDKIANDNKELSGVTFAKDFGGITDIAVGSDGYIYIVSLYQGGDNCIVSRPGGICINYHFPLEGAIFRIIPAGVDETISVK